MIKSFFLKIITIVISVVDYSNKRKVVNFFQKYLKKKELKIIDIGAHKGETIDLFLDNFSINKIYAFEPNLELFNHLKNSSKYNQKEINFYNFGVGEKSEIKNLNIMLDSSSSTLNSLDTNTNYYRRKLKFFSLLGETKTFLEKKQQITVINLSDVIFKKENHIDILKIDTEGYEYNVLKGLNSDDFKKINFIYFEHHYDLMIKKGYNFRDIHYLLLKNHFTQKYKIKMKFRKSFEYIYESEKKNFS
tara:strand:+ start:354 stop:1094 length:741 start_codon:yes stop_codon:yes gene_type:complete